MIYDTIKSDLLKAVRSKDEVVKTALRTVLGASDLVNDRSDESLIRIMRQMVERSNEFIGMLGDKEPQRVADLQAEMAILQVYLPRTISRDQVRDLLAEICDAIRSAPKEGVAIGLGMKKIKEAGILASGEDVRAIVQELRSGSDT